MTQPTTSHAYKFARLLICVLLIGATGAALTYIVQRNAKPDPANSDFEISYETTRLTKPLTEDGYVDYLAAMQESRTDIDEWTPLIDGTAKHVTYIDPDAMMIARQREPGGTPDAVLEREREVLWKCENKPFTTADSTEIANIVASNEPWYEALTEAGAGRAAIIRQTLHDMTSLRARTGVTDDLVLLRFRWRINHALGSRNWARVTESLRVLGRVAERAEQTGFLWPSVAGSPDTQIFEHVRFSVLAVEAPPDELLDLAKQIVTQRLPHRIAAACMDTGNRYRALDELQELHRTKCASGLKISANLQRFGGQQAQLREKLFHTIDWGAAFRFCNEYYDEWSRAFGTHDGQYRRRAVESLVERTDRTKKVLTPPSSMIAANSSPIASKCSPPSSAVT